MSDDEMQECLLTKVRGRGVCLNMQLFAGQHCPTFYLWHVVYVCMIKLAGPNIAGSSKLTI